MTDHVGVARHRRVHAAYFGPDRDLEFVGRSLSEDTIWHWTGKNQFSGDYVGVDAVLNLFGDISDWATGEVCSYDFLGNADHTVALGTIHSCRGQGLEVDYVEVCRWRGYQIVEEWLMVQDHNAVDDFWSHASDPE